MRPRPFFAGRLLRVDPGGAAHRNRGIEEKEWL